VPKIDWDRVPEIERRLLAATLCAAMKRFYEDPENKRKYEEWLQARGGTQQ